MSHHPRRETATRPGQSDSGARQACGELYLALETLGIAVEPEDQELRVMCLQTLSGSLADAGRLPESPAVLHDVTDIVERDRHRGADGGAARI